MAINETWLPEFDQEMANTRKTLERVPEDRFDWAPHKKSGTMVWLAGHLANIPSWASICASTTFPFRRFTVRRPMRARWECRGRPVLHPYFFRFHTEW